MSANTAPVPVASRRLVSRVTWRHDARQRKTQASLEHTILTFAAERPSTKLSVTEITDNAGINRSTFYAHTPNPTAFLRAAMRRRLEWTSREQISGPLSVHELIEQLLDHVRHHQQVYVTAQQDPAAHAALRDGLADFTQMRLIGTPFRLPAPVASLIAVTITHAIYPESPAGTGYTAEASVGLMREGARTVTHLLEQEPMVELDEQTRSASKPAPREVTPRRAEIQKVPTTPAPQRSAPSVLTTTALHRAKERVMPPRRDDSPWVRLRAAIEADFVDGLQRPLTMNHLGVRLHMSNTSITRRIVSGVFTAQLVDKVWVIDVEASRAAIGAAMWTITERRKDRHRNELVH
ncbi:hypothetical protein ITJ57_18920 [Plantibacter sp. VKM Ac-2880]|uniref:TetR/AcrR family transcriptional regulator n=1 Tax=Plantibacter sp. VKM Ac-2880 TaxID=2783827 RepID=UPI00188F4255|nr:hypothetical protein [Plantibacter sp. VKM Ac-2880]MBF4570847.1 hypothetical protein [Plantibacter sp. VKM Ac-2880]